MHNEEGPRNLTFIFIMMWICALFLMMNVQADDDVCFTGHFQHKYPPLHTPQRKGCGYLYKGMYKYGLFAHMI